MESTAWENRHTYQKNIKQCFYLENNAKAQELLVLFNLPVLLLHPTYNLLDCPVCFQMKLT